MLVLHKVCQAPLLRQTVDEPPLKQGLATHFTSTQCRVAFADEGAGNYETLGNRVDQPAGDSGADGQESRHLGCCGCSGWVRSLWARWPPIPRGGNTFNSAGVMQGLGCHAAMSPETAKASCHHAASWLADVSEHAGVAGNAT